jgi:uncharacterized membrane protein
VKRRRSDEGRPPARHPYRDSAIFNGVLAAIIIVVTAATGGNLFPGDVESKRGVLKAIGEIGAIPIAAAFFVLATAFNWWRLGKRVEEPKGER